MMDFLSPQLLNATVKGAVWTCDFSIRAADEEENRV